MAYTIRFLSQDSSRRDFILLRLQEKLIKDGRFKATLTATTDVGIKYPAIKVKPVRLVKAKSYCGNHPGICQVSNRPKPRATYLEWDDWVKFHKLINTVLNKYRINADVYSTPADITGKMWIRKGLKPRIHYSWEEKFNGYRMIQVWNPGTDEEFVK